MLSCVSGLGANVLDVEHSRISGSLDLGEADIVLALETRGPEHCKDLEIALTDAGYTVV